MTRLRFKGIVVGGTLILASSILWVGPLVGLRIPFNYLLTLLVIIIAASIYIANLRCIDRPEK